MALLARPAPKDLYRSPTLAPANLGRRARKRLSPAGASFTRRAGHQATGAEQSCELSCSLCPLCFVLGVACCARYLALCSRSPTSTTVRLVSVRPRTRRIGAIFLAVRRPSFAADRRVCCLSPQRGVARINNSHDGVPSVSSFRLSRVFCLRRLLRVS